MRMPATARAIFHRRESARVGIGGRMATGSLLDVGSTLVTTYLPRRGFRLTVGTGAARWARDRAILPGINSRRDRGARPRVRLGRPAGAVRPRTGRPVRGRRAGHRGPAGSARGRG